MFLNKPDDDFLSQNRKKSKRKSASKTKQNKTIVNNKSFNKSEKTVHFSSTEREKTEYKTNNQKRTNFFLKAFVAICICVALYPVLMGIIAIGALISTSLTNSNVVYTEGVQATKVIKDGIGIEDNTLYVVENTKYGNKYLVSLFQFKSDTCSTIDLIDDQFCSTLTTKKDDGTITFQSSNNYCEVLGCWTYYPDDKEAKDIVDNNKSTTNKFRISVSYLQNDFEIDEKINNCVSFSVGKNAIENIQKGDVLSTIENVTLKRTSVEEIDQIVKIWAEKHPELKSSSSSYEKSKDNVV